MSLIIRYLHKSIIKNASWFLLTAIIFMMINDDNVTNDELIQQVERNLKTYEPKLTGDILGEVMVNMLKNLTLNLKNCVGIGIDRYSVMVSIARGAVNKVQSYATNSMRHCLCSNNALNLSISNV